MAKSTDNKTEQEAQPARVSTDKPKIVNLQAHHMPWLYGLLGIIVLILVFIAGVSAADHRGANRAFPGAKVMALRGEFGVQKHGFGPFGGGMASNNGQTRTRGVVTSISGSSFTIAGNGSTTNVDTNSSTQYQNGNQVKQNDSVLVFGTNSKGTITATQIVINP